MKYTLGEICNFTKGPIGITKAIPGDYPMVTMAAARKSHQEYHFDTRAVIVPLVSSTGHGHASMRRVHYQEGKFTVGSILCAIEPKDDDFLDTKFLYIYLSYFKDQLLVPLMRGAANVSLSIKNIKTVEIEVPSMEQQQTIIELIQKLQTQADEVGQELQTQQNDLQKLRQSILQAAIQGQLLAQGPTDEAADQLLARIQAEKARLVAEKKIKKAKPLPPIEADEIPFALPKGWIWCRGSLVAKYVDPQPSHRTPPISADDIPYISMKDISKEGIINLNSARKVSKKVFSEHQERYKLQDGDFIFGKIGTIGNPVWLPEPFEYTISANLILIQPSRKVINPKYLFYFLSSPSSAKYLKSKKSEMSYPVFGMKKARLMPIPLPPLAEQKRIVAKVEALLSLVADLEAQVQAQQTDVARLMQSVLQEAFEG